MHECITISCFKLYHLLKSPLHSKANACYGHFFQILQPVPMEIKNNFFAYIFYRPFTQQCGYDDYVTFQSFCNHSVFENYFQVVVNIFKGHLQWLERTLLAMAIRVVEFLNGGTKLERFLHKNQHTQRKLLKFEFWINGELSKIGHHLSNKVI